MSEPRVITDSPDQSVDHLQQVLDRLSSSGGGILKCQHDHTLDRPLLLKSGTGLVLEQGVVLQLVSLGAVIAHGAENILLEGPGTIQCSEENEDPVVFKDCKNVDCKNLKLRGVFSKALSFYSCEKLFLHHLDVRGDGPSCKVAFLLDACSGVHLESSSSDLAGDGLWVQCTSHQSCQNMILQGLMLGVGNRGICIGEHSVGDICRLQVNHCIILPWDKDDRSRANLGCGCQIDVQYGAVVEDLLFNDLQIGPARIPVRMELGGTDSGASLGALRRIYFSRLHAKIFGQGCLLINGHVSKNLEDIHFNGVDLVVDGGVDEDTRRSMLEALSHGSEMFGRYPANALFAKYVAGLFIDNLRLSSDLPDQRSALTLEACSDMTIRALNSRIRGRHPADVWQIGRK